MYIVVMGVFAVVCTVFAGRYLREDKKESYFAFCVTMVVMVIVLAIAMMFIKD